jgi:menaquinone-dependent protoporphyrinogen oxidase
MKPILIALVSPSGSTEEICGHLRRTFEAAGYPVEVADLATARDLSVYAAAVVAAPIHGMRWMPEAVGFVDANLAALKQRPVALVATSYLYFEGRPSLRSTILKGLEAIRVALPHASVQVFGGRLPAALPTPVRWLFGVKKGRPLDLVNPEVVGAWASEWVRTVL